MPDYPIHELLALCRRAGAAISEHYHAADAEHYISKSDDSPLTRADLASHDILEPGLAALDSRLPVLSEESVDIPTAQRRAWPRFWLVDPLDGTKEFLARTGEFTINVALVEGAQAVLGLIYLPLSGQAYLGIPELGAWRYQDGESEPQPLATRPLPASGPLTVLSSRRHRGPRLQALLDWLQAQRGPLQRNDSGSALKFCQLAEGRGDIYPRFAPCCEWDTAAGQALLEAAGGQLLDLTGQPLSYNQRETLLNPDFIALADPGAGLWQGMWREPPF
jgi:3'(2'), 5'-bisphosphate nucleotidase